MAGRTERARRLRAWLCVAALVGVPLCAQAVAAPGYSVTEIPLPDFAAGDVVVVDAALFVGVGPGFSGAAQAVVRLDGAGTTVVAEGFSALAGFAYDAVNDRLLVTDNGAEAPGAETGDTLYAIANPLGDFGVPLRAPDIEVAPAGAVPGIADIVLDPNDPAGATAFVTDASESFPPAGRVLAVDLGSGALSGAQSGLGFAAGLAADAGTLFIGDVDGVTFAGAVSSVALPGATGARTPVTHGLAGLYDVELASDGSLLATAAGEILRIDPASGDATPLASGFGFATGLFESSGTIWVLDGGFPGVASVFQLTPIPEPGAAAATAFGALGVALLAAARRRRRGPTGTRAALVAVLLLGGLGASDAAAGRTRARIECQKPAPGQAVTWAPLDVQVTVGPGMDAETLEVLLNGHDLTDALALEATPDGGTRASAADVWEGLVLPGGNQLIARVRGESDPRFRFGCQSAFQAVGDPYADAVVSHAVGPSGGFPGPGFLPGIVTGPPQGAGLFQGGLDVFSLGFGGRIVLRFDDNAIVDGPGADFTVFENAFLAFNAATLTIERPFADPAIVSVSQDGSSWRTFPCSLVTNPAQGVFYPGCAGVYPVLSDASDPDTPHASIPTGGDVGDLVGMPVVPSPAPAGAGGDSFDLAQVGLAWARYVRIVDANVVTGDPFGPNNAGADVDAVAAIHSVPATDADANGVPDAVE